MEISASSNIITIDGNIKSVGDYQKIKSVLDMVVSQHKVVVVNLNESLSMTSSVIGYFNKLILKDKIDIIMNIHSQDLIDLLDDLNLSSLFKIRKV